MRVHQLIQRAVYEPLPADHTHHCTRTAADALLVAWPAIERDTDLATALRANTTVLYARFPDMLWQPDLHHVLDRLGRSLGEAGQVILARDHFQHMADTAPADWAKTTPTP